MTLAVLSVVLLASAPAEAAADSVVAPPPIPSVQVTAGDSLARLPQIPSTRAATGGDSLQSRPSDVRALRVTTPISIDGVLSEAVWQGDNVVTDFKQRDPVEGAAPSQRTEVRVVYDDDAVYVGARLYDTAPDSIYARLSRRDVSIAADRFAIYLDPLHDRRSGYYFMVNAAGTLFDGTLSNDGWEDSSWDGVWHGHAHRDDHGWSLEMRIPFSQLRFQRGEHNVWGVNFRRVVARRSEEDFLVYLPKQGSGFVSRFPDLVGIEDVRPSGSLELLPYVTSKAQYLNLPPQSLFHPEATYKPNAGGDLRLAVGSRMTLNATVNPDFGQVEVDPAVVNLSDVESYFQEKRPFFVEGSSIFRFGNEGADSYWGFNWPEPTFFYSRRIGRRPQADVPDTTDLPVGTKILGAAKLIGKPGAGWNFGTLHAVTARELASYVLNGARGRAEVEPLTYYGAVRTQKELKDRRQGIGFMTTLAARSFYNSDLRDELNHQSVMTGLDGWVFLDPKKDWVISGWSTLSHVTGTKARITALQRNSTHYFQRPDASHVSVDPNATSLTGFGSRYWLNKQNGNVIFNSGLGFMTPGFDVNDMGFQSRADVINGHIGGGYKWTATTQHRKYQDVIGAVFSSYDFQGNLIWGGVWGGGFTEFANNWSWEYKAAYNPQTINNRRTRGGPLTLNKPGYELFTYFDTDSKQPLFYSLNLYGYTQPDADSWNWSASPAVEWKPASNVLLQVGPGYARERAFAQYVTTDSDPAGPLLFGNRYVFANLDYTEVSANVRLNWAFTPNLSLQTFVQPLISTGSYSDYKALARARSYDFAPTPYPDNQDFSYRSLRGNAVMRWEYMPGSTFFLAWTQQREDSDGSGDFRLGPNCRQMLRVKPDNILLAKVTYYLSR